MTEMFFAFKDRVYILQGGLNKYIYDYTRWTHIGTREKDGWGSRNGPMTSASLSNLPHFIDEKRSQK